MFGSLPDYFELNDSYKDSNGDGLLKRFLQTQEDDAEEIKSLITSIPDNLKPLIAPVELISYIANSVGNPPAFPGDTDSSRTILNIIYLLNKYKGTWKGFYYYIRALGLEATVMRENLYGYIYDDSEDYDDIHLKYDYTCNTCPYKMLIEVYWQDGSKTLNGDPLSAYPDNTIPDILDHLLPLNVDWDYMVTNHLPDTGFWGQAFHYPFRNIVSGEVTDLEGTFSVAKNMTYIQEGFYEVAEFPDGFYLTIGDYNTPSQASLLRQSRMTYSLFLNFDDLLNPANNMEVLRWFYANSGSASDSSGFGFRIYDGKFRLVVFYPTKDLIQTWNKDTGNAVIDDYIGITDAIIDIANETWFHVGIVLDEKRASLYIDGELVSWMEHPTGNVHYDGTHNPNYGVGYSSTMKAGKISTFRAFSGKAATPEEINILANEKNFKTL